MKTLRRGSGDLNRRNVQGWLAGLILIAGLWIIFYATLKDFDFQSRRLSPSDYLTGFRLTPSSFYDFPRNVLLFMPLGFGLASILDRRGWSNRSALFLTLLISFAITLLVETLQFFLPGRTPNLSDLLANSLGGLAGLGFYYLWRDWEPVSQWLRAAAAVPSKVLIAGTFYLLFLLLLGCYLLNRTQFTGWNNFYTLLAGNEQTGDRPWYGAVSELMIYEVAFSPDEVFDLLLAENNAADLAPPALAYYPLTNGTVLADEMGNLPEFEWQGDKPNKIDEHQWLQTVRPPDLLSQKLQESGEFEILLTVQTADLQQNGPARILSYSFDTGLRNFTLGQEGPDLILRVRSPMSGENGASPEFVIPEFFEDHDPQKIAVGFDGLSVTAVSASDQHLHKIDIVPGVALLRTLKGSDDSPFSIGPAEGWVLMAAFYIIFFIPLGILLTLLLAQIKMTMLRLLILLGGMLIPTLLLEILFSVRNGFEPRLLNIFWGMAVVGLTVFVLSIPARQLIGLRRTAQS